MSGFGGVAKRGTVTDFAKFPDFAALKVASGSKLAKSATISIRRRRHPRA